MTESSGRPPIRGAAFDLDGLLVNTEELYQHVGTELLARRGCTFEPDLLDRMMGRPQQVSLQIMIDWHGLELPELASVNPWAAALALGAAAAVFWLKAGLLRVLAASAAAGVALYLTGVIA